MSEAWAAASVAGACTAFRPIQAPNLSKAYVTFLQDAHEEQLVGASCVRWLLVTPCSQ
jgi:hypothetical protein